MWFKWKEAVRADQKNEGIEINSREVKKIRSDNVSYL